MANNVKSLKKMEKSLKGLSALPPPLRLCPARQRGAAAAVAPSGEASRAAKPGRTTGETRRGRGGGGMSQRLNLSAERWELAPAGRARARAGISASLRALWHAKLGGSARGVR